MKMTKNLLMTLAFALTLASPMQASAGKLKKLAIGAGLITGGVVLYKMSKGMSSGSITHNLAFKNQSPVEWVQKNPEFKDEIRQQLDEIRQNPNLTQEEKKPYVNLDTLLVSNGAIAAPTTNVVYKNEDTVVTNNNVPQDTKGNLTVGGLVSDEVLLEANMKRHGMGARPNGFKAFHIVAVKKPEFKMARDILAKVGLNIHAAENGIYLPLQSNNGNDMSVARLESNPDFVMLVMSSINNAYAENPRKESVIKALKDISLKLSNGQL